MNDKSIKLEVYVYVDLMDFGYTYFIDRYLLDHVIFEIRWEVLIYDAFGCRGHMTVCPSSIVCCTLGR